MSSPTEKESADLKGGHPPATKAGGMRIVQHKKDGEKEPAVMTAEEKEEYGVGSPPKDKTGKGLVVSGVVTKGDKDFPAEAVKSFHEKPRPSQENRPKQMSHAQNTPHIHQPR